MKDWAEKLTGAQAKATARALRSLSNLVTELEIMNRTTLHSTIQIKGLHEAFMEARATLNSKLEEYFDAPGTIPAPGKNTPAEHKAEAFARLMVGGTSKACSHAVSIENQLDFCTKCGVDLRSNIKRENIPFPDYVVDELYFLIECSEFPPIITNEANFMQHASTRPDFKSTPMIAVSTNGRKIDLKTIKHGSDLVDQCGRKVATIQFGVLNFDSIEIGSKRLGYFTHPDNIKHTDYDLCDGVED